MWISTQSTFNFFESLFFDDDFKKINDSLGHETGDKLLIESAQRLQEALRKDDTLGRLGGDEFIVLLRGITDHHSALKITEILISNKNKASKLFDLYDDFAQEKINLHYKTKNTKLLKILDKLKNNKLYNNKKIRSLVRLSGTEPLVRILVEGQEITEVKKKSLEIKRLVRPYLG